MQSMFCYIPIRDRVDTMKERPLYGRSNNADTAASEYTSESALQERVFAERHVLAKCSALCPKGKVLQTVCNIQAV